MKHLLSTKLIWFFIWVSINAQAQIRIGAASTNPVNPAAALEIQSGPYLDNSYRGFLLPRVALINYVTWSLKGLPTDGMIIFNTATTSANYAVSPGIYCWYNFQWNRQSPPGGSAILTSVDCLPDQLAAGTYLTNVALSTDNKKQITVTPGSAGSYTITTNLVNNFSYATSGVFTTAQVGSSQTVTLQGTGKPQTSGISTFALTADTQTCSFTVNVSDYVDCRGPLNGVYKVNQPLNGTNTKQITIVPQAAGDYFIRSIVYTPDISHSFSFTKSIGFTADQVGFPQTVLLQGNGTPAVAGTFTSNVQVSLDGGYTYVLGCSFALTIIP